MKKLLLLILLPSIAFAVETEVSGNFELQGRHSKNNDMAKTDLLQDWNEEQFYFMYGNLSGKMQFEDFRLEVNGIARHARSDLYNPKPILGQKRDSYLAPQIYLFPNRFVARDLLKIEYQDEGRTSETQAEFNKFFFEWNTDEHRFTIGRLYINYGQGEIFNPINPFNQPTGLTSIQQVAQGNDGMGFKYYVNDKYNVEFFLLGDLNEEKGSRENQIEKTLWAHGEYQYSDKLQIDYVAGEDLNRYKLGGQVNYKFEESMIFFQALYQSHILLKNKDSNNLWDVALGYDEQMNAKWHIRAEGGYQKRNRYATATTFDRFLPTEYFVAIANTYELHPLVKLAGTVVNDIKSGFTYLIGRATYNSTENTEIEIFTYQPVAKGDAADNPAQKLVTSDIGLAFRAFF